jgi:3-phosphoshikimate 1-carboxyvinyltransferase
VAPLFSFPIRIKGIGHTRYQETDRIKAMATELQRIGVTVEEEEAALAVHPFPGSFQPEGPMTIRTYKDHRVAMSFGILGCSPRFGTDNPWLQVADPDCCGKTFPGFFKILAQLYRNSHDK